MRSKAVCLIVAIIFFVSARDSRAVARIVPGATSSNPSAISRFGTNQTTIAVSFDDLNQPALDSFKVTLKARAPYSQSVYTISDHLGQGQSGMTITDNGGGSYSARIDWNPPDNAPLGFYDLYALVSNGVDSASDNYDNNLAELQLTLGGGNIPPQVISGATSATPVAVERIGANSTFLSTTFIDGDDPGIGSLQVTFKLKLPDNSTELILADNIGHGVGGLTIIRSGVGVYIATIGWDPPDNQELGFYDLYFHVTDGFDIATDDYFYNLNSLQIYDAVSNNLPTTTAGNSFALPNSVNRIGSGFTMIKSAFSDVDVPGIGQFTVTFRLRDQSATEYTLINSARNGEQGLRILHTGGINYEASFLWDPLVSQAPGSYDIEFTVSDDFAGTASDGFDNNSDELQVTSAALLGDGNLLRRSHTADNCGGPNAACHNLVDHESNDCLVCHSPHGNENIYLVRDTISTPNSGKRNVIFKTLGIGDPYNDPDPTPGDPNSGVMADATDGVYTGVCEVCHTATGHHRNDNSTPPGDHNDSENCVGCHLHSEGFAGGESGGGAGCSCHAEIFATMDSSSLASRHILANTDPDYAPGASGTHSIKNCLTCHVDHDIFRPDLNPGIGQRAKNLRSDAMNTVVPGDNTVLLNSDYQNSGSGGLCLSCHTGNCNACHSAHKSGQAFDHTFLNQAEYDNTTSAHNYGVPTNFTTDGSTFLANCVKCHNDDMTKVYQGSTYKFSTHGSSYAKILSELGLGSPSNPLEEQFCYQCHSSTSNPNAGANLDYFGIAGMSGGGPLDIEAEFSQSSIHPITATSGVHQMDEEPALMTRHVECTDCHDPHAATSSNPPLPALNGAMIGASGIDINGNEIVSVTYEYQVCLKCHGDNHGTVNYVKRVVDNMNVREEFHPSGQSFHPVADTGKNPDSPSLIGPWTENSMMTCSDCHSSSGGNTSGPHGSQFTPILKLQQVTTDFTLESSSNYALCYSCHSRSSILNDQSFAEHDKHIRGEDTPCTVCHDPHGVNTPLEGDGTHLINFDTTVCFPDPKTDSLAFIDDGNFRGTCYVLCHGKEHSPKSY